MADYFEKFAALLEESKRVQRDSNEILNFIDGRIESAIFDDWAKIQKAFLDAYSCVFGRPADFSISREVKKGAVKITVSVSFDSMFRSPPFKVEGVSYYLDETGFYSCCGSPSALKVSNKVNEILRGKA